MDIIKTLTTPNGQQLVNVPADLDFLLELGFDQAAAQALLAAPLADLKATKAAAIRAHRDALTESHITIDGNQYHSDVKSRIQQMALAKLATQDAIPAGLHWMTRNNGPVLMTNAIALQFEPVTLTHDVALFAVAQTHIDAVNALDTAQGVEAYDFSSGWPTT